MIGCRDELPLSGAVHHGVLQRGGCGHTLSAAGMGLRNCVLDLPCLRSTCLLPLFAVFARSAPLLPSSGLPSSSLGAPFTQGGTQVSTIVGLALVTSTTRSKAALARRGKDGWYELHRPSKVAFTGNVRSSVGMSNCPCSWRCRCRCCSLYSTYAS